MVRGLVDVRQVHLVRALGEVLGHLHELRKRLRSHVPVVAVWRRRLVAVAQELLLELIQEDFLVRAAAVAAAFVGL